MSMDDWLQQGRDASKSAYAVLRTWLPENQAEAARRAGEFELAMRGLRCNYHRLVTIYTRLRDSGAPDAVMSAAQAVVVDAAKRYMKHVGGTFGTYEAAEAALSPIDPDCNPGVGVAPVVVVGVVAAIGLLGGAGAYAVSSVAEAGRDVGVTALNVKRAQALSDCVAAGSTADVCLSAMGKASEVRDSSSTAEALQAAADVTKNAGSAASSTAMWLGLGILGAAGAYAWSRS